MEPMYYIQTGHFVSPKKKDFEDFIYLDRYDNSEFGDYNRSFERIISFSKEYKFQKSVRLSDLSFRTCRRDCWLFCKKDKLKEIEEMILNFKKEVWPTKNKTGLEYFFKFSANITRESAFSKDFFWDIENDFWVVFPRIGNEKKDLINFQKYMKLKMK